MKRINSFAECIPGRLYKITYESDDSNDGETFDSYAVFLFTKYYNQFPKYSFFMYEKDYPQRNVNIKEYPDFLAKQKGDPGIHHFKCYDMGNNP